MIYYTMRFKSEANKLYYVYVNDDFNKIESTPQILFEYPMDGVSAIDGDITKIGDKYHCFMWPMTELEESNRLYPTG